MKQKKMLALLEAKRKAFDRDHAKANSHHPGQYTRPGSYKRY